MNVGDIVMSVANYRLREQILQTISQCSSNKHLNEGCSVGYAGLNQDKLKRVLYSTYHSYSGLDRVELAPSTTIGQVIDLIIKRMPVEVQGTSYAYSTTTSTSSSKDTCSSSSASTFSSNTVNMEKRKYEYVIGIDLGHGETSAAICPLQWDTPVEQLDPVKDLEMGGNKKVIPSAITILDNGNAYIGDSAFNPEILKQAEVYVCFKKAPKDINGESEKLMMRFMQEVYKRIRENNSAMLTDNNHLVYIATPSGWDKQTQDLYLQMATQAGLPMGGITKESRAAFVRAQHDVTSGLGKYVDKGAIVFDMGSSTLDFTYMTSNSKLIDHGYDCGASFIEKTIFKNCEEKFPAIQQFEKKYEKLTPFLLFEARKVKEQVYFDPNLKVKKTINFEDFIDDEDFEDDRFKMVFQPKELNSLLEQVGYIKEIEDAAYDFVNNHIHNASVYGVFLTGGASRMDFIKPLVSKCWNVPESQIYRDQDPSLTISQGVAEVARMDLRTEGMDNNIVQDIKNLQKSNIIYSTIIENLTDGLYLAVNDNLVDEINGWGSDTVDRSLEVLQGTIRKSIQNSLKNSSEMMANVFQSAIKENLEPVQQKVNMIISHYSSQTVSSSNATLDVSCIQINNVNLDGTINEISNTIIEDSSGWTEAIAGGAIGLGIALFFGGPLAWLIGGGALLGKYLFGEKKSEWEKKKEAMSKKLNAEQRKTVLESIGNQWEEIQKKMYGSIESSIKNNSQLKNTIIKETNKIIDSYEASLKKARILID